MTEVRARAAWLDQGAADPETFHFLCDRVEEALDAPFGRVIERAAGERHLAAHAGQLQDPPATPGAQMRKCCANELDRADQMVSIWCRTCSSVISSAAPIRP